MGKHLVDIDEEALRARAFSRGSGTALSVRRSSRARERSELARAAISDLEIGYSARSAAKWNRLAEALDAFELVETTSARMRRARQVQRLLASKHQRGRRVPDLLVAAAAEAENLVVLHYDADCDRIAAVTGQPCEWVVAAGSLD